MGRAAADDRSKSNRIATPTAATPRTGQCNRQALQLFELLACNGKRLSFGRATPVFFLGKENGGRITRHLCRIDIRTCAKKEEFSFEKENIPLSRVPHMVWGIIECALRAQKKEAPFRVLPFYSTVTDFARLRGLSISHPRWSAI